MRIGQVIGTVTLSRWHPAMDGGQYRVVMPLKMEHLTGDAPNEEEFVVYDELGAGAGQKIAISEGGEAAQPFYPDNKPIDAYNAAILDAIDVEPLR